MFDIYTHRSACASELCTIFLVPEILILVESYIRTVLYLLAGCGYKKFPNSSSGVLVSYAESAEVRIDARLLASGHPRPSHVDAAHHFKQAVGVCFLSYQECAAG